MAWFGDAWSDVLEVAVSASGAGSFDVTVNIDSSIGKFWSVVDSAGDDIRVTTGDGQTALVFQLATWTYATKTATIEIQGYSAGTTSAAVHKILIYYGNASASSTAGSFTASTPKTGIVCGSLPRRLLPMPGRPDPGQDKPAQRLRKSDSETITLWIGAETILESAIEPVEGRSLYDEIAYVILDVQKATASQASMFDHSKVMFQGRNIRIQLKAGTNTEDHTVILKVAVTSPVEPVNATAAPVRIEEFRAILEVRNPVET